MSFSTLGARSAVELLLDFVVSGGVDVLKRKVFELPFDLPDTKTVRERRENLQRFLGDAFLTRLGHGGEGPHVMEAVGQFDDHDPEVLGHREKDLAQVRRRLVGISP